MLANIRNDKILMKSKWGRDESNKDVPKENFVFANQNNENKYRSKNYY
jgi:hypothetical protein